MRMRSSTHSFESSDTFINNRTTSDGEEEVSIRIIGAAEQEDQDPFWDDATAQNEVYIHPPPVGRNRSPLATSSSPLDSRSDLGAGENVSQSLNGGVDAGAMDGAGANGRDSSYQRYDIQQAARLIEQVLPFSLLLLVVFIRQHFQGFFCYCLHCCCDVQVKRNFTKPDSSEGGEKRLFSSASLLCSCSM